MKTHIGVNAATGLTHCVIATSAPHYRLTFYRLPVNDMLDEALSRLLKRRDNTSPSIYPGELVVRHSHLTDKPIGS